ncbi:CaiB/BaiF CoA transferase family protein [Crystallibacter crystallopoietes]|uniref:CaiB/BaiF CoA transferase family protein n=1 Tax=Crystallibacter crystallopoietes TaxID=37928 RepID=UPI00123742BE|nr:CoA transferase [Arthrobacter crystallopoietes]
MKSQSETQQSGPLAGVTVLEVSSVVMAPMAGRIMAKLGAQVIRVEPPQGDVIRRTGAARHESMTGAALALGDGKLNIAVNLRTEAGRAELRRLIVRSDVVITNHLPKRRPGFGLDWESVREIDDTTILCTAQGYSSLSELADVPAYDDTVQAAAGTCDIYAKSDGVPRYAPYVMADKICGLTIVYSILAALHHRDRTGQGQWVDVPMVDVMADFNLIEQLNDYTFEPALGAAGWHRTLAPARKPHPAQNGWICILPYTDQNWRDFLHLAGVAATTDQTVPFPTNRDRNIHTEAVQGIIADYAATKSIEEIVRECTTIGIPAQPVHTIESLMTDPYLRSRDTVELIDHPSEGKVWRSTPNIGFSATPLAPVRYAGKVDQDRDEIIEILNESTVKESYV